MKSIREDIDHFRDELRTRWIQEAHKALLGYMRDLRTHFVKRYPGYSISGLIRDTRIWLSSPLSRQHSSTAT